MILNSKGFSKRYFARHIKDGVVHYRNSDGSDKLYLVTNEALRSMNPSFEGKPIYIRHVDKVNMETLKTDAVGYVVKSFYNEFDGAWWAEILADDEAQGYIEKGWAVSNAYLPTELGSGGVYHDIKYDKQVLNGEYEHLAIVDNPRYEEAVIMTPDEYKSYNECRKAELEKLKNSKENEMLSEEDKKELLDSLKNSLAEIVKDTVKNAIEEKKAEELKNAKDEVRHTLINDIAALSAKEDGDFEGGLDEKVKSLISLAEKLKNSEDDAESCKNEEEEEEKDEEEKKENETETKEEEETKENSETEEEEKANESDESLENKCKNEEEKDEEEKKENSKFFNFLHNAKDAQKSKATATMASGLALGRIRYGSK